MDAIKNLFGRGDDKDIGALPGPEREDRLVKIRHHKHQLGRAFKPTEEVIETKYFGHRDRYEQQGTHDELVRTFLYLCAAQSRWLSWDSGERTFVLQVLRSAQQAADGEPTRPFRDHFHRAFWTAYNNGGRRLEGARPNLIMRILTVLFHWDPASPSPAPPTSPVKPGAGPLRPTVDCEDLPYVQEYLVLLETLRQMAFPASNVPGSKLSDNADDKPPAVALDDVIRTHTSTSRDRFRRKYRLAVPP
jgi:hypothetical protein